MIKCTLISPQTKRTEEEITGIYIETTTGQLGILTGHLPIIAKLKNNSRVRLIKQIGELKFTLSSENYFQFLNNEGIILAHSFTQEKEY